jgi:hypothetical protein
MQDDAPALLTEDEPALVSALQLRPRASWTELGRALGVDPVTGPLPLTVDTLGGRAQGDPCLPGHARIRRRHQVRPRPARQQQQQQQPETAAGHRRDVSDPEQGLHLSAFYRRIAARRGRQRAWVAVMHKLAVAIWHILRNKTRYQDLGADYFTRHDPERAMRMTKETDRLGLTARFGPIPAA